MAAINKALHLFVLLWSNLCHIQWWRGLSDDWYLPGFIFKYHLFIFSLAASSLKFIWEIYLHQSKYFLTQHVVANFYKIICIYKKKKCFLSLIQVPQLACLNIILISTSTISVLPFFLAYVSNPMVSCPGWKGKYEFGSERQSDYRIYVKINVITMYSFVILYRVIDLLIYSSII